jgi:hypothetical protein
MFAEIANIEHLEGHCLPTGHWPMWSRPRDLAKPIQSAASRTKVNGTYNSKGSAESG